MNAYSISLAHTARVLHWSAPVYVLDVAETDSFNYGRTAVLGCEFAPDANERSIESTLLELRSRVGNMSVGQLIRNGKDRYAVRLSKRLDTRSAPLAAFIASLANRKARHQSVSAAFFAPFPSQRRQAQLPIQSARPAPIFLSGTTSPQSRASNAADVWAGIR